MKACAENARTTSLQLTRYRCTDFELLLVSHQPSEYRTVSFLEARHLHPSHVSLPYNILIPVACKQTSDNTFWVLLYWLGRPAHAVEAIRMPAIRGYGHRAALRLLALNELSLRLIMLRLPFPPTSHHQQTLPSNADCAVAAEAALA